MKMRAFWIALGALGSVVVARGALGERPAPIDRASLFFISKSENRNQVAFEVRLDPDCRPSGDHPVFEYWRMLERSNVSVEPLLAIEQAPYGIASQRIVELGPSGRAVRVSLRALPSREILVRTERRGSSCFAEASTRIEGTSARLVSVHARIAWPFGVDSLVITGWAESDGRLVRETMRP
jgi:hypothetical protein